MLGSTLDADYSVPAAGSLTTYVTDLCAGLLGAAVRLRGWLQTQTYRYEDERDTPPRRAARLGADRAAGRSAHARGAGPQ